MRACPQCNADLEGAYEGLCPACVAKRLLLPETEEGDLETVTAIQEHSGAADEFGPYRILKVLGEGGMGTVYLAMQEAPIRRRVALKVIKAGLDSAEVLGRFNRERQALALMEHSSIARILDAGSTKNGRPYFVMEYVDGQPITAYCDEHRLAVHKRLALFLAVCRGVHHAHERGVIHRDIKPSNVLVTEEDGEPVPKVIDFGIAKAAGKLDDTVFTQFGKVVGTPQYASPEQADVLTGVAGAPSDVYSLGVLLYELLVGTVPFDTAGWREAGLAEILRVIREEDPPSLPSKLTEAGMDTRAIAARRATDAAGLRKLLARDLDWVVRKALEKPVSRRYESVAAFAADVERFLNQQPVKAAPPSVVYRASKLLGRHRVAAAVCATVVLAFPAGLLTMRSMPSKLTARDTIVVADFANSTGDPIFDDTLRLSLTTQLAQSPYLSIEPDGKVRRTMAQMKQPADARLTAELAREVCERMGSAAVVEGSVAKLGSQYVITLSLRNCQTGELLNSGQAQASRKEEVLAALAGTTKELRLKAGESLAMVEKHLAPVPDATTASLEALKALSAGRKAWAQDGPQQAIPHHQRAVQLDPAFAMAYADLGDMYYELEEVDLARENTAKAYALRDRVTDSERFQFVLAYDRIVTGDLEKARLTGELWAQTYPRAARPRGYLSGLITAVFGRFEAAAEHAKKAIELDPDFGIAYFNLSRNYLKLGKYREAEEALSQAASRGIHSQEISLQQYDLAFLRHDRAAMESALAQAQEKPDAGQLLTKRHALTLGSEGRLESARALTAQAKTIAVQGRHREQAAEAEATLAVMEAFAGEAAARRTAASAVASFRAREVCYFAALALAMAGDSVAAGSLADELGKRYPEDTTVQFQYLPVLGAQLALNAGDPAKAIEFLQKAQPNETGAARALIGELYPCYFRGLAYRAAHRPKEAAAEFQKLLDHRGSILSDPVGPAARWQLARSWSDAGEKAQAQAVYRDLMEQWREADPAMPALLQVKSEAALLGVTAVTNAGRKPY